MAKPKHAPGSPELSVVSTDTEHLGADLPAPFLELEIRRGKTSYPTRPVSLRNFLIGSGPSCDLRLGGESIPVVHTALIVASGHIYAQWLGEAPPLRVNGEPIQEITLCEGDRIEIGRFEFIVRHLVTEAAADAGTLTDSEAIAPQTQSSDLFDLLADAKTAQSGNDLGELSASEVLDLLEAEQSSVECFEDAVRQAEAAILYAAAHHAENLVEHEEILEQPLSLSVASDSSEGPEGPSDDSEILDELERVIQQLSMFSSELELRSKRIEIEEATQAEAAELLLDAQKELASQLERFHKQMSESQQQPEPRLRKAA